MKNIKLEKYAGTMTNIKLEKYAGVVCLDRSPSLASPVTLLLYKKKISGTEVWRTPDEILDFSFYICYNNKH